MSAVTLHQSSRPAPAQQPSFPMSLCRIGAEIAVALLLLHPVVVRAQIVWNMPTEYPQSAMPGLGLTTFSKRLNELSAGKLEVKTSFDATAGIRSAGMISAVMNGQVQASDAFASALEAEDPIFALPSLPFLVTTVADAKRLAEIARPFYPPRWRERANGCFT